MSTIAESRAPEPLPPVPAASGRRLVARSVRPDRLEHNIELCECMIDIAAALFGVSSKEMRSTSRSSQSVSRVRQVAMYVAHVALCIPMGDIGRGFGRDRTTVVHACHLVEDLRDHADFDRLVAMTERIACAALRGRRLVR